MTKAIRIENADMSDYKLTVQVWDEGQDVGDGILAPDTLISETAIDIPTAMVEVCIHRTRYVVIKEKQIT